MLYTKVIVKKDNKIAIYIRSKQEPDRFHQYVPATQEHRRLTKKRNDKLIRAIEGKPRKGLTRIYREKYHAVLLTFE